MCERERAGEILRVCGRRRAGEKVCVREKGRERLCV